MKLKFLKGAALTNKIQSMLGTGDRADIAIAYWGADALTLLKLKPKRRNVRVVCCLKGGKSDPDVIKKFKARARQHDKLHAKVVWTPDGAVVGSANASSNGLPEEEFKASGLIEAGVYLNDATALAEIQEWFDELYSVRARRIEPSDLDDARLARRLAPKTGGGSGKRSTKSSLLELAKTILKSKVDQPIWFALYRELSAPTTDRAARQHVRENSKELRRVLKIQQGDLRNLEWFVDWPKLPRNAFLIDCYLVKSSIRPPSVVRTFHSTRGIGVKTSEGRDNIHFVLNEGKSGFNFRLSREDALLIRKYSKQLWAKADGDEDSRLISLKKAAPVLLGASGASIR